ncbi:MAG TPA: sigma 54-interacting transcriptional regulator, partial [Polyangiaceae bacterium]|nr:sigma 54-interacting transcriptional regulator [Polyangiaceae bacterium]
MSDTATLDVRDRRVGDAAEGGVRGAFALVLAGSTAQPQRVGEALVVPDDSAGTTYVFGRGEPRPDDAVERLLLVRQLPGHNEARGPLADGFVSRQQITLASHEHGVQIENIGKLAVSVDGQVVRRAVVKPGEVLEIDGQLLFVCVRRASVLSEMQNEKRTSGHAFGDADDGGIVGESPLVWELRDRIAFVAPRTGHVLLLGESGTGKELVAQAIHARSARSGRRLVSRNAATLPPGLIDAELFGNVANYPNHGMPERPGLIGDADGSTLFLDEIGELPEALQTHLLRVLDDVHEYQRLGESRRRTADLRLVAATNRPIEHLKPDLAARLQLRLRLPSLDERLEDVPLLVRHLLRRIAARERDIAQRFFEAGEPRVSIPLARALLRHRYATNVRQLNAILWTSLASSPGTSVDLTDEVKRELQAPAAHDAAAVAASAPSAARARSKPPADITAETIRASLARHNGVKDRVWPELGLSSRFALRRLMKKHGI